MRKNSVVRILNMRYTRNEKKNIGSAFLLRFLFLQTELAAPVKCPVKGGRTAGMIARRFV